jgi:3D (Asp-Asp-Asp) domain-containing protein
MPVWSPRARRLLLLVAVVGLVLAVFTTRTRDSNEEVFDAEGRPLLGAAIRFDATAYCKGDTAAAGVGIRHGIAAADPTLLPLGSVVRVDTDDERFAGIWTVLDTGPEIKGRELDLYIWSCNEALAFGRQPVRVTILRLGWDPARSAPDGVNQLFRRRERTRAVAPPAGAPPTDAPPQGVPPAGAPPADAPPAGTPPAGAAPSGAAPPSSPGTPPKGEPAPPSAPGSAPSGAPSGVPPAGSPAAPPAAPPPAPQGAPRAAATEAPKPPSGLRR